MQPLLCGNVRQLLEVAEAWDCDGEQLVYIAHWLIILHVTNGCAMHGRLTSMHGS